MSNICFDMEDKGLISFSLESFGKMNLLSEDEYKAYMGYFMAEVDTKSDRRFEIFRYPCRINAYIALLCVEGSVEITSNLKHYNQRYQYLSSNAINFRYKIF